MTTTSARVALPLTLLLASPALAQSQGDTGIGASIAQAQAGIAEVRKAFDDQWDGEAGRWVKGGIGVAGLAAALLAAGDSIASETGKGTIRIEDGSVSLDFGAAAPDPAGGGAPTLSTSTTSTR
ncbi:MAG: hypothetical protein RIM84_21645 [Alphaproteobacteria bacterium]